ncbi:MAG: right-handed parallel beta-helix repeat-containing protein [Solirubrobacterales bacterium]
MTSTNRITRVWWLLMLTAIFLAVLVFAMRVAGDSPEASAETYYFDSIRGDDAVPRSTEKSPWKTLGRLTGVRLKPGDAVKLRSGSVWREELVLDDSGAEGAPITVTRWGKGAAPRITKVRDCVTVTGSWVHISGVNAERCGNAAFTLSGTRNAVRYSRATRSAIGVFATESSKFALISRNYIARNNIMFANTPQPTTDDAGAFGVLLHGVGAEVAYNTIVGHDAFSYDFKRDGSAVELYGATDSRIHHNKAFRNHTFVELGKAGTANNTISRNRIETKKANQYGLITRGAADTSFGPVLNTIFAFNKLKMTGRNSHGFVCSSGCTPEIATIMNNRFDVNGTGGFADFSPKLSGNVFVGGKLDIESER